MGIARDNVGLTSFASTAAAAPSEVGLHCSFCMVVQRIELHVTSGLEQALYQAQVQSSFHALTYTHTHSYTQRHTHTLTLTHTHTHTLSLTHSDKVTDFL